MSQVRNERVPKPERKRQSLQLLADTGLALPPRVIYVNLVRQGATFSYKTVHRHLQEALEDGLVDHPPEKDDYYMITDKGRQFLGSEINDEDPR